MPATWSASRPADRSCSSMTWSSRCEPSTARAKAASAAPSIPPRKAFRNSTNCSDQQKQSASGSQHSAVGTGHEAGLRAASRCRSPACPTNSHFARVLVAADYRMKRLAMNLDPAPIAGFPSYVELLKTGAQGPERAIRAGGWPAITNRSPRARTIWRGNCAARA